jgi:hypothetical protein
MKMKINKIKSFLAYASVLIFMLLIIAIPILTGCQTEDCFKSKYVTGEAIATLMRVSTHGKSLAGEYKYEVNGKIYNETFRSPTDNFEEIGDQLYLLYDTLDPSNSFLSYRFFVPDNLVNTKGKIAFYKVDKKEKEVSVVLQYELNNQTIKRNQYFPIDNAEVLEKLFKEKKEVIIGVVPENIRRGYLKLEESMY